MNKIITALFLLSPMWSIAQQQEPLPFNCNACLSSEQTTLNSWIGKPEWSLFKELGMPAKITGDSITGYTYTYEHKTSYTRRHTATTNGTSESSFLTPAGDLIYLDVDTKYTTTFDTKESYTRLYIAFTDKNKKIYQWVAKNKPQ